MIQGLQIDISGEELKTHLTKMAGAYEKKAGMYAEKAKKVAEVMGVKEADVFPADSVDAEDLRAAMTMANAQRPVDDLRDKWHRFIRKSAFFKFMADHIVTEEKYRLSEEDLTRLEILDRYM